MVQWEVNKAGNKTQDKIYSKKRLRTKQNLSITKIKESLTLVLVQEGRST